MVIPEVIKSRDKTKFCAKLGHKPREMFSLFQRGMRWECTRNEKVQCLSGTHGLSNDKRAFKMALGADAGR